MRKKSVTVLAITSVIASIICIVGLGLTLADYFDSSNKSIDRSDKELEQTEKNPQQAATKNNNELQVVALGDSLTRGAGDSEGKGYVGNVISQLEKKTDQKVLLSNLGVNGLTSEQLVAKVQEKEIQRQISNADLVLVTIGGNDLFRGGQGLTDMSEKALKPIEISYEKNLTTILSQIRKMNANATVYFVGLYNPFIELDNAIATSKVVRAWNYKSAEIIAGYPKTVFVPTFDLFQLNVNDYLYTDQFHPNTKGYQLIADRLASLISFEKGGEE